MSDLVMGNLCVAGDIHLVDDPNAMGRSDEVDKIPLALVIEFETVEDVRRAMSDGACQFSSFSCRWKVGGES